MLPAAANLALAAFRTAKRSRGLAATYARGDDSVQVTVVTGRTRTFLETVDGLGVQGSERDFLVEAADLVLDDERIIPKPGDIIALANGEDTMRYEVGPLAGGKHYESIGDMAEVLRIHTTHSETAATPPPEEPE